MAKRGGKGGIWILVLILSCILFLFLLNINIKQNTSLTEGTGPDTEQEIELSQVSEEDLTGYESITEEKEDLWILFDNLKFSRQKVQRNLPLYGILLIIYILLIGPVTYFGLKRLGKMEWMWVYIPVAAVLFSVVILWGNRGSKVTEPIVDALTVLSPQQDNVVYVATTSPGRKSYELTFDSKVKEVVPLYMSGEYAMYGDSLTKKSRPYTILEDKRGTTLCLNPQSAFTRDYIRLDLKKKERKEFEQNLVFEGEIAEGTIINNTEYYFDYVMVYWKGQFCTFRTVDAGEERQIEKSSWMSIYSSEAIKKAGTLKEKNNDKQILTFAYEKYFMEAEENKIYVVGVLRNYDGAVDTIHKDLVSRGLYYQWFDLDGNKMEK